MRLTRAHVAAALTLALAAAPRAAAEDAEVLALLVGDQLTLDDVPAGALLVIADPAVATVERAGATATLVGVGGGVTTIHVLDGEALRSFVVEVRWPLPPPPPTAVALDGPITLGGRGTAMLVTATADGGSATPAELGVTLEGRAAATQLALDATWRADGVSLDDAWLARRLGGAELALGDLRVSGLERIRGAGARWHPDGRWTGGLGVGATVDGDAVALAEGAGAVGPVRCAALGATAATGALARTRCAGRGDVRGGDWAMALDADGAPDGGHRLRGASQVAVGGWSTTVEVERAARPPAGVGRAAPVLDATRAAATVGAQRRRVTAQAAGQLLATRDGSGASTSYGALAGAVVRVGASTRVGVSVAARGAVGGTIATPSERRARVEVAARSAGGSAEARGEVIARGDGGRALALTATLDRAVRRGRIGASADVDVTRVAQRTQGAAAVAARGLLRGRRGHVGVRLALAWRDAALHAAVGGELGWRPGGRHAASLLLAIDADGAVAAHLGYTLRWDAAGAAAPSRRAAHGEVFHDRDGDGRRGAGEPGLAGVTIELDSGETATTDRDGRWRLAAARGTARTARATVTSGWRPSTANPASLAADGPARRAAIGLTDVAALTIAVAADDDGDGAVTAADVVVPGATLTIRRADGVTTRATTDVTGHATVPHLAPGRYQVDLDPVSLPAGVEATTASPLAIDLGALATASVVMPVAIHRTVRGRAWIDLDDDRAPDPGEPPLTGATVECAGQPAAAPAVSAVVTAAGGYACRDLAAGTVVVTLRADAAPRAPTVVRLEPVPLRAASLDLPVPPTLAGELARRDARGGGGFDDASLAAIGNRADVVRLVVTPVATSAKARGDATRRATALVAALGRAGVPAYKIARAPARVDPTAVATAAVVTAVRGP